MIPNLIFFVDLKMVSKYAEIFHVEISWNN